MFDQVLHFGHRIMQLGVKNFCLAMRYKLKKIFFRFRVYEKKTDQTWTNVSKKLGVTQNFEIFFNQIKQQKTFEIIFNDLNPSPKCSDAQNCFCILGSKPICFDNDQIEWQKDFKVEQFKSTHAILNSQWQNKQNIFYQDIMISSPKDMGLYEYNPDIKIPWELSRFQHLADIANAYKKTHDLKYTKIYKNQLTSWIDDNPAFQGVNWVCPMETAIRVINWIHALHQFKNDTNISSEFWQRIVRSLYEHATFIENNWEWSDKPNNHYLADLLGYLYLCEFFCTSAKFKAAKQKTINTMLEQFFRQILPDGTAYEGSTNYHKLDTEIFLHFKILCQISQTPLPQEFHTRFIKMQQFILDCNDNAGNFVQVGDNDSGKIMWGINLKKNEEKFAIKVYPNFGLTIVKSEKLHLTFRNATFDTNQPTGHFHQDQLSITLSINNIPVIVDPGTYVYTANTKYRNLLRSAESHNTFYLDQQYEFGDLFQLNRNYCPVQHEHFDQNSTDLVSFNGSYKTGIVTAWRNIELKKQGEIKIKDWIDDKNPDTWQWNLIFAPYINIDKLNANLWIIKKGTTNLLSIESTLDFNVIDWFYSAKYGHIKSCKKLEAQKKPLSTELITIKF